MNAAKDVQLLSDQHRLDPKRLELLKEQMDAMVKDIDDVKKVDSDDYVKYFGKIERKFNKLKARHEEELEQMF